MLQHFDPNARGHESKRGARVFCTLGNRGLGYEARYWQDCAMANSSGAKTPPDKVTAAGLVEAIEQDVELSMEQVKNAAQEAIAAVEKKLARKPVKKPPAKVVKKATAKAPAKKKAATPAKPTTSKAKKRK
jgi:hypothetical protein